jgi:hypothetical protein
VDIWLDNVLLEAERTLQVDQIHNLALELQPGFPSEFRGLQAGFCWQTHFSDRRILLTAASC